MTAYHDVFFPIFGAGCAVAVIASFLAGKKAGCVLPGILFVLGVVAFWIGLFLGSDLGFRAWQSIPNPPAEAFTDTAPLGALILGWLPGGAFCFLIFGLTRIGRLLLSMGKPNVNADKSRLNTVETGNPYQSPQSQSGP